MKHTHYAQRHGLIDSAVLPVLPVILRRWLPDGHLERDEYVARNPTRDDRHLGSFKINLTTGCWADFATGDGGRGAVSLAAYLFAIDRAEAARRLRRMMEPDHDS